jgi:oxygen-dependent protoporphyrinogen oxidase
VQPRPHVVVLGGGISGLVTAMRLREAADGAPEVTLIEAGDRLGGKIWTRDLDGRPVEAGPDAFVVRVPAMSRLVTDLGLDRALVAPAGLGAYVWTRGALRRLPTGTAFGVPDRVLPLVRSGLLSPRGLARAGLDLVLPQLPVPVDPTVDELLRPRFGSEFAELLVEPLVGGVHAGSTRQLSARSVVPDVEALARGNRSLFLALRRRKQQGPAPSGPMLLSLDGGLRRLVSALADRVDASVLTGRPATALERTPHGWRVTVGGGADADVLDVDAVVLATPAYVTAELLRPLLPTAADALAEIPYVDVATVTLAYPRTAVGRPLDATGFLVPPVEGRLLVGCTWVTAKWPRPGHGSSAVFRAMVGRAGDQRFAELTDDELVLRVHAELDEAVGLGAAPSRVLVQRWPRALPQYVVGHQQLLTQLQHALDEAPGLHLTGAAYRGAGIAACVEQAETTARLVLDELGAAVPEEVTR